MLLPQTEERARENATVSTSRVKTSTSSLLQAKKNPPQWHEQNSSHPGGQIIHSYMDLYLTLANWLISVLFAEPIGLCVEIRDICEQQWRYRPAGVECLARGHFDRRRGGAGHPPTQNYNHPHAWKVAIFSTSSGVKWSEILYDILIQSQLTEHRQTFLIFKKLIK